MPTKKRKNKRKRPALQQNAQPSKSSTSSAVDQPPSTHVKVKTDLIHFLPHKWTNNGGRSPSIYQYDENDHDKFSTMFADRPWQPEGISRIVNKVLDGRSHFITDDCGTGKTVQIVTALHVLTTKFARTPVNGCIHLILVENDMIATHWCDEFQRWFPDMNFLYYTGSIAERNILRQTRFGMTNTINRTCFRANTNPVMPTSIPTIVIATNALFQKDHALLFSHYPWYVVIVDEGHWVKNNDSNQTKLVMSMTYSCSIVMSGTILSKDLDDIWGLHSFITNNIPPDSDDDGVRVMNWNNKHDFQAQIQKYMPYVSLHRTINLQNLPPCIHLVLKLELSHEQHQYAQELQTQPFNNTLKLRRNAFAWYSFEVYPDGESPPPSIDSILNSSSKLNFLNYVINQLNGDANRKGNQHRALVFAFFKTSMELIKMVCIANGFPFHVINGDTSKVDKQKAIEEFESPTSNVYVLILGLDAASKGINLLNGDIVLLMEPQPTPFKELQAACRSYRANSIKPVKIITVVSGANDLDIFSIANGRQTSNRNAMAGGGGVETQVHSDDDDGWVEYDIERLKSMSECSERNRQVFKSILFDDVEELNVESGHNDEEGLMVWHTKNMNMDNDI